MSRRRLSELRLRSIAVPLALLFTSACQDVLNLTDPTRADGPEAPALTASMDQPAGLENGPPRFIVTVADGVDGEAVAQDHGVRPEHSYSRVLNGFAGEISDAARSGLLKDGRVVRIDRDRPIRLQDTGTQSGPTWGLDRIDQRESELDGMYTYAASGRGVTVYVVDTGLRYSHTDFGGRASFGFDAFGEDGADCYGHGTHVGGTAAGRTWGVAKDANLVSVRIYDCTGYASTSTFVAGIDWILANVQRPAVVNLSVISDPDELVDQAVQRLIDAGITAVAAAGNDNADACGFSPARLPDAITVAATTHLDARASYSNWGDCVDWFAPGSAITSASHVGDDASTQMSGTSMSTPHTTGVAALYLEQHPNATPADVYAGLTGWLTRDVVTDWQEKRNWRHHLLHSGGSPGENRAPVADFTFVCEELTCSFTDQSEDSDGTVMAWSWDFGGGAESAAQHPQVTFADPGTYRVDQQVTDDQGAIGSVSRTLVLSPGITHIMLSVNVTKVKGRHRADLLWIGAEGPSVDLYRNGEHVGVVPNSGQFTDLPGTRGKASFSYQVCEVGTETCSVPIHAIP